MSLIGINGDVTTWSTADGRSISVRNGVLVSTRGFGADLMSADVNGTIAALNGGLHEYEKFLSFLNGENRQVFQAFFCRMVGPEASMINSFGRQVTVSKWTETCLSPQSELVSTYWISQGDIWLTQQELSPQLGKIITERLNE